MTYPSSDSVSAHGSAASGARRAWPGVVMAIVVAGALTAINVTVTPRSVTVLGLLATVPFIAAIASTLLGTLAAGVIAASTAALMGDYDHATWTRDLVAIVGGIAAATLAAAGTAGMQSRRLRQLRRSRAVADVVQQTLLRPVPAKLADVRIAARYASATRGAQVGGDIFEALDTPYGLRVFVGDVRGKGLPALYLASAALGAFRERAYDAADLSELAAQLDVSVARNADIEDFVTAVLVQVGNTDVQIVNCAHPSPVLLSRADVSAVEPEHTSLPLGLGVNPAPRTVPFGRGDRLLLYTDGVSDARRRGRYFDVLAEAAHLDRCDLDELVVRLHRRLVRFTRRRLDDDVAMLVLERDCEGPPAIRQQAAGQAQDHHEALR